MKNFISLLLASMFIIGLSFNLSAQSNEEELDQLELLKQFEGTWKAETGEDSAVVITYEPIGNGFLLTQENMANGDIYLRAKAIMGVSNDKKTIIVSSVTQDGEVAFNYGKFVSDKKSVFEFYVENVRHPFNIQEFDFQSPDAFTVRGKYRGEKMTWDANWWDTATFHRVK